MRFLYKGPGQKITCVCELFSKLIELILDSSKLLPVEKIVKSISIFLCIWANQASAINLMMPDKFIISTFINLKTVCNWPHNHIVSRPFCVQKPRKIFHGGHLLGHKTHDTQCL